MPDTLDAFGPFKTLFESNPGPVPGYLMLLNPKPDAIVAVRQLREAAATCAGDCERFLRLMFQEMNWRPQLVAAATLAVTRSTGVCIRPLWAALDRPCWTSPQLAATALRVDPLFVENAKRRLERRCELVAEDAAGLSWPARHSALGPTSIDGHSAKLMAALVALCRTVEAPQPWLDELLADGDVQRLLAEDVDSSGEIAVTWLDDLDAVAADVVRRPS